MIASSEWLIFRRDDIEANFLRHLLISDHFHQQFMATVSGVGGSLLRARPAQVFEIQIPIPFKNGKPDLAEQKRIAAILDKADGIRRKRREALQLADDFLRSCFLDMFGDPVTSGWVSDTVEGIANKEKGSIRTGPFGSQLLHSEFVDKGIRVLGIDNAVKNEFRIKQDRFISEEKYESLKRYTVHPNDVIITIMGTCGRCAIVPEEIEPAINTKHLCCITLNRKKCLPEYLHAYFLTHPLAKKYLKDRSKGAIMDGLNMGIIKALPVAMPPIQLQQHFVKICKVVNEKKRKLEIASTTCNDLFASLQQRAFKGEL
jgi:type I restriction enzyme S subunit